MSVASEHDRVAARPAAAGPIYKIIARQIGRRLREHLDRPEADPLPVDHVDLLLRLRHKERDRSRTSA
ncbi:hypothetical protein [Enterovirga sp. CN4-39]|uniref:hypothetical protein n=1 Tax=Enterovirga sp. CN4-39 TaxID=3400910 RepID=UPI003C08B924